jgi:hypothetical protein
MNKLLTFLSYLLILGIGILVQDRIKKLEKKIFRMRKIIKFTFNLINQNGLDDKYKIKELKTMNDNMLNILLNKEKK